MCYQVVDFGGVKRMAEKRSEIPRRLSLAENPRRTRSVTAHQRHAHRRGQRRIAPGEIPLEGDQPTARHVSTWQRLLARPVSLHLRKKRLELGERRLRESAVSGDLAAEDRQ